MKRFITYLLLVSGLLLLVPASASADLIPSSSSTPLTQIGFTASNGNDFQSDSMNNIVSALSSQWLDFAFAALSALAVLFLLVAGIQYMTSGGSADKTKKARQSIINIILAIVLLVSAYVLLQTIVGILTYLAQKAWSWTFVDSTLAQA